MNEFYLLAPNDLEASICASRVIGRRKMRPAGWFIEPLDPPAPRTRRLCDWWAPRPRLYRVTFHNP